MDRNHMLNVIAVLFGGRIAEEIFMNQMTTGASNDFERATQHRARHGHALRHVGPAGPDGLRRERGRSVPRPLDHDAQSTCPKRRCARSTARSARSSTSSTRSRASCSRTTATRSRRWRRRCSSSRRSTPTRSTTSWHGRPPRPPKPTQIGSGAGGAGHDAPGAGRGADGDARLMRGRRLMANAARAAKRAPVFRCGAALRRSHASISRPLVMGILNVTPDSFSDGGTLSTTAHARSRMRGRWRADGADLIDVGGESTRPGAPPVAEAEELRARDAARRSARARGRRRSSVDTRKPAVMRAAIAAGAAMINDVARADGAGRDRSRARRADVGVCLMHMQGEPANDAGGAALRRRRRRGPRLSCVGARARLRGRRHRARAHRRSIRALASARRWRIISRCCARCRTLAATGLSGARRAVAQVVARRRSPDGSVDERLPASLAAALAAVARGAAIVRVHDVRETVDALEGVARDRARR